MEQEYSLIIDTNLSVIDSSFILNIKNIISNNELLNEYFKINSIKKVINSSDERYRIIQNLATPEFKSVEMFLIDDIDLNIGYILKDSLKPIKEIIGLRKMIKSKKIRIEIESI